MAGDGGGADTPPTSGDGGGICWLMCVCVCRTVVGDWCWLNREKPYSHHAQRAQQTKTRTSGLHVSTRAEPAAVGDSSPSDELASKCARMRATPFKCACVVRRLTVIGPRLGVGGRNAFGSARVDSAPVWLAA